MRALVCWCLAGCWAIVQSFAKEDDSNGASSGGLVGPIEFVHYNDNPTPHPQSLSPAPPAPPFPLTTPTSSPDAAPSPPSRRQQGYYLQPSPGRPPVFPAGYPKVSHVTS